MNLTQIPSKGDLGKEIRSAFIAAKGYKYVGGDFSGCELRIIAHASQDPIWINAFNEGKDLHTVLACITFGIEPHQVKDPTPFKPDITYRDVQKTINFGLAYGMSEFKLSKVIDVDVHIARDIIDRFFKAVPGVESYLRNLGNYGTTFYKARTLMPFFRVRYFDPPEDTYSSFKRLGEIERQAKNHPIQGANGDIVKAALVLIRLEIIKNNYPVKIINVIHDEIITECVEEFAEEWRPIMEALMIKAAGIVIKSIPMKVDCKITDKWEK